MGERYLGTYLRPVSGTKDREGGPQCLLCHAGNRADIVKLVVSAANDTAALDELEGLRKEVTIGNVLQRR